MSEQETTIDISDIAGDGPSSDQYWIDFLVQDLVVVETKTLDLYDLLFEAQALNKLKNSLKKAGLLFNLDYQLVKEGFRRFIL